MGTSVCRGVDLSTDVVKRYIAAIDNHTDHVILRYVCLCDCINPSFSTHFQIG